MSNKWNPVKISILCQSSVIISHTDSVLTHSLNLTRLTNRGTHLLISSFTVLNLQRENKFLRSLNVAAWQIGQRCITTVSQDSVSFVSKTLKTHQRFRGPRKSRRRRRKTFLSSRCVSRKWTIRSHLASPPHCRPSGTLQRPGLQRWRADTHSYKREQGPVDFDPDMVHSEAPFPPS